MATAPTALDFATITDHQRAAWSSGDFNQIARQLMHISEDLVAAVDPRPGRRVLDVACGSGNTALVAARRYCDVVGIDFAPNLIECARARAAADGVEATFLEADAQQLPFPDDSFDAVVSVMGVMFAPDQERAAAEMLRVCRPGGTIGLAAWPPDSSIADFFRVHAAYGPPSPDGLQPPFRWGTEDGLADLLGARTDGLRIARRKVRMFYLSPEHAVDVLQQYFGPTMLMLDGLEDQDRRRLLDDVLELHHRNNTATDGTLVDEAEYVLATATVTG